MLLPTQVRWSLPGDLRRAGAPPPVVRVTCVVLFPVAFLAMALLLAGFFTTFDDG